MASAHAVDVRPAVREDAEAILTVHYAAVHGTASADYDVDICRSWSPPVDAERVDAYHRNAAADGMLAMVAVVHGRVVGFAAIVPAESELQAVYVAPDVGRRGIGARLLHAVESLARELGVRELHLDASLNAERFYAAHGYTSEGRAEHTLRSGVRMACMPMRKAL